MTLYKYGKLFCVLMCFTTQSSILFILTRENLFIPYANNKGTDQPVCPISLIGVFIIDRTNPIDYILKNVKTPASFGRFESFLVAQLI